MPNFDLLQKPFILAFTVLVIYVLNITGYGMSYSRDVTIDSTGLLPQ